MVLLILSTVLQYATSRTNHARSVYCCVHFGDPHQVTLEV